MREHEDAGVCTSGSGHVERTRQHPGCQIEHHGIMPAGEKVLDRECVLMVISCACEDDPAG